MKNILLPMFMQRFHLYQLEICFWGLPFPFLVNMINHFVFGQFRDTDIDPICLLAKPIDSGSKTDQNYSFFENFGFLWRGISFHSV